MQKRQSLAYCGLAILFLIWVGVRVRASGDVIDTLSHGTEIPRPFFDLMEPDTVITSLLPAGEAAGLKKGDILLSYNGKPYEGVSDLMRPMRTLHVGFKVPVEVRRDGASVKLEGTLPASKEHPPATRDWIISVADDLM